MSDDPNRRSFLRWCVHGMGAIFAAVLGVPALTYITDPRHRPPAAGGFRPVSGISLAALEPGEPVQGTIRDVRRDAWTLFPNDVVGRVWVKRVKDDEEEPDVSKRFQVWSTVCPHLGCSINSNGNGQGFTCPCHNAEFNPDGTKKDRPGNVAPRGMDTLDFRISPDDPDVLEVKYQEFQASRPDKVPVE